MKKYGLICSIAYSAEIKHKGFRMKNNVKFLGIIAIILVIGSFFSGCKEAEEPNLFVGTWEGGVYNYRMVFTETNVTISHLYNGETFINSPYSYDSKNLYYKNAANNDIYWVYRFEGNTLILMATGITHYYTKIN